MFCMYYTINNSAVPHTGLMSCQIYKHLNHYSQIWRTQRDTFTCSKYKQASLITTNKPVQANTWSPVTTKHGKVCGKMPMAVKQRNCFSVTCTSHKLNWVHSIYTVSNTDNPDKSNEPMTRKQHCPLDFTHKAIIPQPQNNARLP